MRANYKKESEGLWSVAESEKQVSERVEEREKEVENRFCWEEMTKSATRVRQACPSMPSRRELGVEGTPGGVVVD